jgi:hypothetical protein
MQADNIRTPEELLPAGDRLNHRGERFRGSVMYSSQNLHTQCGRSLLCDQPTDPPHPDDPQRLAFQIDPGEPVADFIISSSKRAVHRFGVACTGQHQEQGVFRDRCAVGKRSIGHIDPVLLAIEHVDVVDADSVPPDHSHPGSRGDHFPVEAGGPGEDCVTVRRLSYESRGVRAGSDDHLISVVAQQPFPRSGDVLRYQHFESHRFRSLLCPGFRCGPDR